ncbi:MAG: formimidoylglutamate deiminase [Comamonadaceae bacterium]|nr:formimidoylglutamate deiminase [Comamonadaceae bacterium]
MNGGTLFAPHALLPQGWARDVRLRWDASGRLTEVRPHAPADPAAPQAAGPLLPGMPNLHSHAFQRAFAGLAEYRATAQDSFWSWRTLMYRFAARLDPPAMQAIATWLYAEMLEAGYTSVCEFQYVHHQPSGQPYAPPTLLSQALLQAAQATGMGITLLPVLYQSSGFGGQPPSLAQRRFLHDTPAMLRLLDALRPACTGPQARLGLAPHSLRAVPPQALHEAVAGLHALDAGAPVHIHIAEQLKEVEDCIAWSGQRPVAWLLEHAPVDARWCLVHATHMDEAEYARAARSGAVAGLCPSTEANLGDGLFDLARWRGHGGAWGIGSDSHVCVNAAEELMLLEYGQRLCTHVRNASADAAQPHTATALTLAALRGGAQATGRPVAGLAVGQQADFVVLDARHPALDGLPPQDMLAAHVFASSRGSAIAETWSAGQRRVQGGRHALHESALRDFIATRARLLAAQE